MRGTMIQGVHNFNLKILHKSNHTVNLEKGWIVLRPGGLKRCAAEHRAPGGLRFLLYLRIIQNSIVQYWQLVTGNQAGI